MPLWLAVQEKKTRELPPAVRGAVLPIDTAPAHCASVQPLRDALQWPLQPAHTVRRQLVPAASAPTTTWLPAATTEKRRVPAVVRVNWFTFTNRTATQYSTTKQKPLIRDMKLKKKPTKKRENDQRPKDNVVGRIHFLVCVPAPFNCQQRGAC